MSNQQQMDLVIDSLKQFLNGEETNLIFLKKQLEQILADVSFDLKNDDEHEVIICCECGETKPVEKGTWALDKGMCEPCYCLYQGG